MRTWITSLGLSLLALAPLRGQTANGIVFRDDDRDGRRSAGEEGLAGVLVSNGREVVRTDAQGRYTLPVDGDTAIFVIKPPDYQFPLNDAKLPQFYYLHKPEGSPELRFPGVAPTGPLPASVNFPLHAAEEGTRFRVMVFGDPQPYSRQQVDYFIEDVVETALGEKDIAFGLTLGDIVGDDLDLYAPLNAGISRLGVPWWNVYGNHDMNFDAARDELADETYERIFGPPTYAFRYGRVWFVVLDNVIYPLPPGASSKYVGGITERQFTFLENLLAEIPPEDLIVLAGHIPLFLEEAFGETFRLADRARLFSLFAAHPRVLSLSAHTHYLRQHHFGPSEGWPHPAGHLHFNAGATGGSWWSGPPNERGIPSTTMRDGVPNGYSILTFDGTDYRIAWRSAGESPDDQMALTVPPVLWASAPYPPEIFANVFLGRDGDRVHYRINDGEWKPMSYRARPDPAYMRLWLDHNYAETPQEGLPLPAPEPAHHLWSARLPSGLPVGSHTLTVETTNAFGDTFRQTIDFRVVD